MDQLKSQQIACALGISIIAKRNCAKRRSTNSDDSSADRAAKKRCYASHMASKDSAACSYAQENNDLNDKNKFELIEDTLKRRGMGRGMSLAEGLRVQWGKKLQNKQPEENQKKKEPNMSLSKHRLSTADCQRKIRSKPIPSLTETLATETGIAAPVVAATPSVSFDDDRKQIIHYFEDDNEGIQHRWYSGQDLGRIRCEIYEVFRLKLDNKLDETSNEHTFLGLERMFVKELGKNMAKLKSVLSPSDYLHLYLKYRTFMATKCTTSEHLTNATL